MSSTKHWIVISVLLACLLSNTLFAEERAARPAEQIENDAIAELVQTLQAFDSFTASFRFESHDESGKLMTEQTGYVKLRRPNRFRWDVQKPEEQVISVKENVVTLYEPILEQVSYLNLDTLAGSDVYQILMDPSHLQENTYEVSGNSSSFLVRSTAEGSLFDRISLEFEHQVLTEINVVDHLGGSSRFVFFGFERDSKLEDSEFEVPIPEGTDVVGNATEQAN